MAEAANLSPSISTDVDDKDSCESDASSESNASSDDDDNDDSGVLVPSTRTAQSDDLEISFCDSAEGLEGV